MRASDVTIPGHYWFFPDDRSEAIITQAEIFSGPRPRIGFWMAGSELEFDASDLDGDLCGPIDEPVRP